MARNLESQAESTRGLCHFQRKAAAATDEVDQPKTPTSPLMYQPVAAKEVSIPRTVATLQALGRTRNGPPREAMATVLIDPRCSPFEFPAGASRRACDPARHREPVQDFCFFFAASTLALTALISSRDLAPGEMAACSRRACRARVYPPLVRPVEAVWRVARTSSPSELRLRREMVNRSGGKRPWAPTSKVRLP
jgi:hypothetical protein